jgi:SAM-dependent methyltransferase
MFYYVLHWLTDPDCVLGELHRVLKPDGILSFRDPYMNEEEILTTVMGKGWFRLSGRGEKTHRFVRITQGETIAPSGL